MTTRDRPGTGAGTWLRNVAVVIAAALFAFLAVVSAALSLAEKQVFGPALVLAPRSNPVFVPAALRQLESASMPSAAVIARLRGALASAPLDYRAMFGLGAAADKAGNERLGAALVARAFAYDPRSPQVRSWLLERDLARDDFPSALGHIDRLLVLAPQLRTQMLAALALLAQEPGTETSIRPMLAPRPVWFPNFFEALVAQEADPRLMRTLMDPISTADPYAQRLYLERLIATGAHEEARSAWLALLPRGQRPSGPVSDPTFLLKAGLEPFAWRYPAHDQGSVELVPGGGMRAFYLSNAPAQLAEQMLVLRPGRYRLELTGHVLPEVPASKLDWRLRCSSGAEVAEAALPLSPTPKDVYVAFEIGGAACPTQRLSLEGVPGDAVQSLTAATTRIAIRSLG